MSVALVRTRVYVVSVPDIRNYPGKNLKWLYQAVPLRPSCVPENVGVNQNVVNQN